MNLMEIKIENFFPLGDEHLVFNHQKYAVFGINHDDQGSSSNGAGKSALLHAIIWCLFGTTPREGILSDGVIGPHAAHVRVVLSFTHKGRTFVIDRGRKVPGRRNSEPIVTINGSDVSLHKGNDKLIEQELGFSKLSFMLAGYAAAKRSSFCELTPAKKLEVLTEVLDLTPYDEILARVKQEGLARKAEYTSVSGAASLTEQAVDQQNRRLAALELQLEQFDAAKADKVHQAREALRTANEGLRAHPGEDTSEQSLPEAERNLEALQRLGREYQSALPKLAKLQREVDRFKSDQAKLVASISELQDRLDNVMLVNGGECAYCGSHITQVNKDLMHAFSAQQQEQKIKLALLTAEVDYAVSQLDSFVLPAKPDDRELERLSAIKTALQLQARAHQQKIYEFNIASQKVESAKSLLDERLALDSSSLVAQLENERAAAQRQEAKLDTMLDEITRISDEMEALKTTIGLVKKTKQEILFSFISSLEQQIQIYFEKMQTDLSVKAVLDGDKLDLLFHNSSKQGVYYSYGVFSGGEAARIDKAVTLALNGVFGIGLYIDDEALASLDQTGSRALVDFLFEDAQDTRLLVFHNKLLEDHFDRKTDTRQILVEKRDGRASLRIE